ncbi:MAG: DUF58 domain-containing protein [Actinomycetales bacterium]
MGQGPGLADLTPPEALRRLEVTVVRRLDGYLRGEHLGLLPGPGTELAEARLYRPGEDDVRHMDWAVTARTTQPHVHDMIADRELETWALADLTGSMQLGTALRDGRPVLKRDLAISAVATVAVLTARLGDRFGGYLLTDTDLIRHPARSGRQALVSMLRDMLATRADLAEPGRHRDAVTLGPALSRLASGHPKRGLRLVVSDFFDAASGPLTGAADQAPGWELGLRQLAARHQVLAVEVVDPREGELPDVGVIELADPETGDIVEIDTSRSATRAAYAEAAARHRERVRVSLRRAGVGHLVLRTDSDWVRDVARFVLRHRTQSRLARAPRTAAAAGSHR